MGLQEWRNSKMSAFVVFSTPKNQYLYDRYSVSA